MVLKFKKIYVDEKFKEDISNNIISYDLILDIFFSKKNSKIFRYGIFCYYTLWFFQVLLPIIFSILILALYFFYKNLYPYLPIAFLSFYVITTSIFITYFKYIGVFFKKRSEINKFFLCSINIYNFYLNLRTHIDDKRQEKDFSKILFAKKILIESKFPKSIWSFASSPVIVPKKSSFDSLPNNDSSHDCDGILCSNYIYKTLRSIEETSNLIYTNENIIDNKKKEKWFKKKYFWKLILYYNFKFITLFWFFLAPFLLFVFSIGTIFIDYIILI